MSKATKRERQKENRERAREERERMLKRQRQMKTARSLAFVLVPVLAIFVVITLLNSNDSKKSSASFDSSKGYTATIATSEGDIVVALDAKQAPVATEHFVKLADDKFYDNSCIDRIARDFVVQGGSKNCDGNTGSGSSVNGERPKDHYPVGSFAAAKTGTDPAGTFDSIFFIVTGAQGATLPNDYARFGNVISGLDVAQKIGTMPIENGASDGKPTDKIAIKTVRVKVTDKPVAASSTTSTTAAK